MTTPSYYAPVLMIDNEDVRANPTSHRRSSPRRTRDRSLSSTETIRSRCFSDSSRTTDTSSSTVPPRRGIIRSSRPRMFEPQPLTCEFVQYEDACSAVFGTDDVQGLTQHVLDVHLMGVAPQASGCCFCTVAPFVPGLDAPEESFFGRMQHVAEHFRLGDGVGMMHRDQYLLDHILHQGLDGGTAAASLHHRLTPPTGARNYPYGWRQSESREMVEIQRHQSGRSRPQPSLGGSYYL